MCALRSAIDRSEDKNIHCFKEQQQRHAGFKLLTQQIKFATELEDNLFVPDNDAITDVLPREMVVDGFQESESNIDID